MSDPVGATSSHETRNGISPNLELDVAKLHSLPSEQQDIYLLTFTSNLVRLVSALDKDGISSQQAQIKKELFKVLTLSSPPSSRVVRNNLGKCFADVLGRGNRSLLFETINDLLGLIVSGKNEKEAPSKHGAVHCLGAVYSAAGESAISLLGFSCSGLLKALRSANNNAGLRSAIYKTLGKIVYGTRSAADESTARDVWKHARSAVSGDRANVVQSCACWCLEQLVKSTPYFNNSNDFESLKPALWKPMESSSSAVRAAAASCLAAVLVKAYSEDAPSEIIPRIRKPKKPSKKHSTALEDGDEIERSESPSKRPAIQLSFNLQEILKQLSMQYVRSSLNPRGKAGIACCYRQVLSRLDGSIVEEQYNRLASHFLFDLLGHPTITFNRYRLLTARRLVKHILEDIVGREILSETSRLNATRWLVNDVLKNYPQTIQERSEPSKNALIGALSALSSLLSSLGSAVAVVADSCRDALIQVLQHPSYTVQIHTSYCLRTFVLAFPQQLLSCLTLCLSSLNREIGNLTGPRHSPRRCVGYANGLAATLSTSRLEPLYGSVDVYSQVLSVATELLKSSSSSELRVSATQIQVAWILIGGLMPLGPNFVKIHLNQLLLLWKNALPRPLTKDNMGQRGILEMSFLSHVRECALGSILVFLEFNSRLVTMDGSKRLATMLQNTILFLDSLPTHKSSEDISQRLSPSLQLQDLTLMVRRRVLQCFSKLVKLSHLGHGEVLSQSNLLTLAISSFADPDVGTPKSVETSLSHSASNFESLWDVADNWGSGVTGSIRGFLIKPLPEEHSKTVSLPVYGMGSSLDDIEDSLLSPICQAREHDSVLLYSLRNKGDDVLADPPATEVVNAAIELFAVSLPLQAPKVQESSLEQITTLLSVHSLHRNPARRAAMTVNVALALLNALKVAARETSSAPGDLRGAATERNIQELLRNFILDPDPVVRNVAAEGMGRFCNSAGHNVTAAEINHLVETIISNRDPNARAGCALAFGCIHSEVGGMAAGFHLKTIIGVLMSLCSDPHTVVHFWALEGLMRVVISAGLTFSGYVSGTLGMIARLYVTDTHNEETALLVASNLEAELQCPVLFGKCVDALINVLGPDLQDMSKTRDLIFMLVNLFKSDDINALAVQGLKCLEHLSVYSPGHMEFEGYVRQLQSDISSTSPEISGSALRGLNNLMKRDAEDILKLASPGLEDDLWLALDHYPDHPAVTNIIRNWLLQTGLTDTNAWIQRCQDVLSKTRARAEDVPPPTTAKATAAPELQDEEVAGFATAAGTNQGDVTDDAKTAQELLKWQTRRFAMACLSELLSMVGREILPDQTIPAETALQQRIGEIVRMAFSASTANVIELRIWGLKIIDQVLNMFGKTPDPDFSEASLLEQYQAQIGSALTPAFAVDSSPELASQAVNVCASFVATGIVTNVDRMGRIFKLLVTSVENLAVDSETTAIGDLKGLSSNARIMVKMAVLSAWAQLQIASAEQKYLVDIVQPYIAKLVPLWISSLQEFARLRFEPEISSTVGISTTGSLYEIYAALNRETLLKFYQDSWLSLVDAIASLVERDSQLVFDALDGKIAPPEAQLDGFATKGDDINYRDEPVAFFFVLFGLAFEALVGNINNNQSQTSGILQALKKILRPAVSGAAIYQDAVFSETVDSLDRLALTEGSSTQMIIVEIARNLSLDHLSAQDREDRDEKLSDDIEQLFELTRIIILVLAGALPNLGPSSQHARQTLSEDSVPLSRLSFNSLVDVAEVFPSIIRADLHASIIHVFCTVLATGACQAEVMPEALPIFKRFIQSITKSSLSDTEDSKSLLSLQLRGCLHRCLVILSHAQRRETETALPCAKNTLLTITILLTAGGSSAIGPNDPLITRLLTEMLDCLSDVGLAKVAANCIRSFLLVAPKNPTDEAIARTLLPRLLAFVTNRETHADPENIRNLIMHTLTSSVSTLESSKRPVAMAVLIPALLVRSTREGEKVYKETAVRLLELASADQTAFRIVVGQMGPDLRLFMEGVIRGGGGGGRARGDDDGEGAAEEPKPSIALRMDF